MIDRERPPEWLAAIILTLFAAAALALAFCAAAYAEGSLLAWDHPGLDVDGRPDEVATYEVEAFRGTDLLARGSSGGRTFDLRVFDLAVPYSVRVRARDRAGNASEWSAPLVVEAVPPRRPEDLRQTHPLDANLDGTLDLSDVILLLLHLFAGRALP